MAYSTMPPPETICKEERDALEEEMRKLDACEEFGRLDSSEKRSLSSEIDGGRRRRNRTVIR